LIVNVCRITDNGQGLAKFGNLKIVCPEPLMIEKLMIKIRTKSPIEKLPPELKPNSELMNIVITSAQILPNPMLPAGLLVGFNLRHLNINL
jgi:hypothetical protein